MKRGVIIVFSVFVSIYLFSQQSIEFKSIPYINSLEEFYDGIGLNPAKTGHRNNHELFASTMFQVNNTDYHNLSVYTVSYNKNFSKVKGGLGFRFNSVTLERVAKVQEFMTYYAHPIKSDGKLKLYVGGGIGITGIKSYVNEPVWIFPDMSDPLVSSGYDPVLALVPGINIGINAEYEKARVGFAYEKQFFSSKPETGSFDTTTSAQNFNNRLLLELYYNISLNESISLAPYTFLYMYGDVGISAGLKANIKDKYFIASGYNTLFNRTSLTASVKLFKYVQMGALYEFDELYSYTGIVLKGTF